MKRKHVVLLVPALILVLVLAALWTVRYVSWNRYLKENYLAERQYFEAGDTVEFGGNFIRYGVPGEGYTLSVRNVSLMSRDEYREKYGLSGSGYETGGQVLDLVCDISCSAPEPETIYLTDFTVHGVNWFLLADYDFLIMLYGSTHYQGGTETETVSIPFTVPENYVGVLPDSQDCYLWLTAYPVVLEVRFDWPV